jgi:hypothetical protein
MVDDAVSPDAFSDGLDSELMSRSQIAQTIQASYFSIPIQSAARLIYFNEDTNQTIQFAKEVSTCSYCHCA